MNAVWRGEQPFVRVFSGFVLLCLLGAMAAFIGAFFLLCAIECSALPWFTMVLGPALCLFIVAPLAVWLGVGAFRASRRLAPPRGALARVVVVSAVLWAPAFSIGGFVLLIALLQPGG